MTEPQSSLGLRRSDVAIAYSLLRILFGISFLIIGFGKLGGMTGFADAMVEQFKTTFLPAGLVWLTAVLVPPVEVAIGGLLILGWFTRPALIAGFALMMVLHTGVTLMKDWNTAANQLIYGLIFFILLAGAGFNGWSVDQWRARKQQLTDTTPDQVPATITKFGQRLAIALGHLTGQPRTRRRRPLISSRIES